METQNRQQKDGASEEISSADCFRDLGVVFHPDPRQDVWVVTEAGQHRPRQLEDHHREIAAIVLDERVPRDIRIHFDTARNLLLYAWCAYRFIQVAELHAYSSVEMALRYRFSSKGTLGGLLYRALRENLLRDEAFEQFRIIRERQDGLSESLRAVGWPDSAAEQGRDPQAYATRVVKTVLMLRNELAHGSPMLMPHGYFTLRLCRDMINQLLAKGARVP